MPELATLEPAWTAVLLDLSWRFGIRSEEQITIAIDAALRSLRRDVPKLRHPIAVDSAMGMILRRRFVMTLAICCKQLITSARHEQTSDDRAFAISQVGTRMVDPLREASEGEGSTEHWFDPLQVTFDSPAEFGDNVPDSYRLCLLECVDAVLAKQYEHFRKQRGLELKAAEFVFQQRLA